MSDLNSQVSAMRAVWDSLRSARPAMEHKILEFSYVCYISYSFVEGLGLIFSCEGKHTLRVTWDRVVLPSLKVDFYIIEVRIFF